MEVENTLAMDNQTRVMETIISVKTLTRMFGGDGVYEIDLAKETAQLTLKILGIEVEVVLSKAQLPIRKAETDMLYKQWILNRMLRAAYNKYMFALMGTVQREDFKAEVQENSFTIYYNNQPFEYLEREGTEEELSNYAENFILSIFFVGFTIEQAKTIHDIKKSLKKV